MYFIHIIFGDKRQIIYFCNTLFKALINITNQKTLKHEKVILLGMCFISRHYYCSLQQQ